MYNKLNSSINYQGFLKDTPGGHRIELVCNEAAGFLTIDRDLTIDCHSTELPFTGNSATII